MPKITGYISDGIDAACTDCPLKLDLDGLGYTTKCMVQRMYGVMING